MRIFPENLATFEHKKIIFVKKNQEEIFANLIQTLTCEASVSIQKHEGSREKNWLGASAPTLPHWGCVPGPRMLLDRGIQSEQVRAHHFSKKPYQMFRTFFF